MSDLSQIASNVAQTFTNINPFTPNKALTNNINAIASRLGAAGLFPGADVSKSLQSNAQWGSRDGKAIDFRVKIILPPEGNLRTTFFGGNNQVLSPLVNDAGVIFPLTPSIVLQHSASYSELATTHSNYPFYAYGHSESPTINVNGDFPVQNYEDAQYWVGMVHFFRSITKMFFGADNANRGNPPPILWLKGYGDYVFNNVPVVVKSFTVTLPDSVDYISTSQNVRALDRIGAVGVFGPNQAVKPSTFSPSWAPTASTVTVSLQPIYSRTSTTNFSLSSFINGNTGITGSAPNSNTPGFI